MLFLTFCGGSEVRIKEQDNIVITVWGATEILMPTLAEKMVRVKQSKSQHRLIGDPAVRRTNVITVMGGTAFKYPTLAREIEEMNQLKNSGALSITEITELWQEVSGRQDLDHFETLTLWGGSGEERPSQEEELQDLERIAAKGLLRSNEFRTLKSIVQGEALTALEDQALQDQLRALVLPHSSPASELKSHSDQKLIE